MRFFERVKLERRIRRLQAAAQAARGAGREPAPADAAALAQAQDDLQVRSGVLPPPLPRCAQTAGSCPCSSSRHSVLQR